MVKNKKKTVAPETPSNNDATEIQTLKDSIESCNTLNGLDELLQKIKKSTLEKDQKEELNNLITAKQEAIKQLEEEGEEAVASLKNSIKATADPESSPQEPGDSPEASKNGDSSTAGKVATVAGTVFGTAVAGFLGRKLLTRIKNLGKGDENHEGEEEQQETQQKRGNKPGFRGRFGEIAGAIGGAVAGGLGLKYLYDHTEITRKTIDWAKDKGSTVWNWCKEQLGGCRDRIKDKGSSVLDWCTEKLGEGRWRIKEAIGLENGKPLDFDEAIEHISSEVTNGLNDNGESFNRNFNGIEYNKNTHTITSYGESTEIDKENKIIKGMPEPKFGDYAELIFAANTVNFLKSIGKGRGGNNTPFSLGEGEDDIQFTFSDGTKGDILSHDNNLFFKKVGGATIGGLIGGYLGNIKGIVAGSIGGGLAGYAAADRLCKSPLGRFAKTISSGSNLILFKNYLNKLTYPDDQTKSLWEAKEWSSDEVLDCPLKDDFIAVVTDIEKKWGKENTAQRAPKIEIEGDTYYISAYGQKIELTGIKYEKNKPIVYKNINNLSLGKYNDKDWGDGLDLKFPNTQAGVQECIRVALMTNYIRDHYNHRAAEPYPFRFGTEIDKKSRSKSFSIETKGLGTNRLGGTNLFRTDFLKEKCPTLYEDLEKFPSSRVSLSSFFGRIPGIDDQEDLTDKFYKDASEDTNEYTQSKYIIYLHQMCGSDPLCRKQAA